MDYRIEAKEAFTVIGAVKAFNSDTSDKEIPAFWCEHFQNGGGQYICGQYGICYDHNSDSQMFNYMIADGIEGKGEVPDTFTMMEIPAKTWAVFPVTGAMPKALQEVNGRIWSEWLPNCREYVIDGNINIELYSDGDTNSPEYYSEIWVPVRKSG